MKLAEGQTTGTHIGTKKITYVRKAQGQIKTQLKARAAKIRER